MTVRELIEALEYCDQDAPVYIDKDNGEIEIDEVKQSGVYTHVTIK